MRTVAELKTQRNEGNVEAFLANIDGFGDYEALRARLGPHKTGRSCLHLKRLDDVDDDVLRELITRSLAHVRER